MPFMGGDDLPLFERPLFYLVLASPGTGVESWILCGSYGVSADVGTEKLDDVFLGSDVPAADRAVPAASDEDVVIKPGEMAAKHTVWVTFSVPASTFVGVD